MVLKSSFLRKARCLVCLFCIGGFLYNVIEILWRGYTHWSMFFAGGACFTLIGHIQRVCKHSLFVRCAYCALAVTLVEFISGCIVNLWWKLNVWDYSDMLLNVKGQVCALYSVLWGGLSVIAMPIYRRLRALIDRPNRHVSAVRKKAG